MQVEIEFSTQVRVVTGVGHQSMEVAEDSSLPSVLLQLLQSYPKLDAWIDATGQSKPGLLLFVNDQSPVELPRTILKAHDRVTLMTLVSGG